MAIKKQPFMLQYNYLRKLFFFYKKVIKSIYVLEILCVNIECADLLSTFSDIILKFKIHI
jgi:hypothetical protein